MGALLAAFTAWLSIFSATPAQAKQCIWNKGAYVLRVDWFVPGHATMTRNNEDKDGFGRAYQEWRFIKQPIQTDWVHMNTGSCIDRAHPQYLFEAVLSICGGSRASRVVEYPNDWPVTNRINCNIWKGVTPSSTRYLDTWGGVLNPSSGDGGGI